MKKLLILAIIIFLSLNAFAFRANILEYDPFPAKAGSFLDVFISIENVQNQASNIVTVEFVPKDSIRLSFGEEAVKEIGIIPFRQSAVVKYRVEITSDATDGENIFRLNVKEKDKIEEFFDLSIEVDNTFPNIEIGDIESEPRKILPNTDDVKITITILNTGDEVAENLRATLEVPEPLEFSDSFSNISLLGNLAENTSGEAVFFIDIPEETPGGKYKARLKAEYTLQNSVSNEFIEKIIEFEIVIKPVPRFEIISATTIPEELAAGDRGVKLKLEIKNVGDEDAESVRVKVFQKSEQPFEFEKAFDFVAPRLKPGEVGEATLEFRVEELANLQKYLIDIEIKSFIDDTVRTDDKVIELNVVDTRAQGPDLILLLGGALVVVLVILFFFRRRIAKLAGRG